MAEHSRSSQASATWTAGRSTSQTVHHIHYNAPAGLNQSQTPAQVTEQMYDFAFRVINQSGSIQVNNVQQSKSAKKDKTRYYKPSSTETPILSIFLISTLIFIAGIEFMLRRSFPVGRSLYTPSDTTTPSNITNALNTTSFLNNTTPGNGTDSGKFNIGKLLETPEISPSMKCIGVERIVSVRQITQCGTAAAITDPCRTTTTQETFEKPIYNVAVPTMPCYVCAMKSQGIESSGWATATTTHNAALSSNRAGTVYPCSSCEGTLLTKSAPWDSKVTDFARLYTTYTSVRHEHSKLPSALKI